ncbi:MAG TPA: ASKHA domain-containing protein [Planctomycetota bacterium]|nr:ASKHA domain-containing protein [Planctomycetota bacterium]
MPTVRIEPDGFSIQVASGDSLISAVERAGVIVDTPCGGRGGCTKCTVRIVAGDLAPSEACRQAFDAGKIAAGWRLACQVRVTADLTVEVPAAARVRGERIVAAGAAESRSLDPLVFGTVVEAGVPSLEDQRADLERLLAAGGAGLAGLAPELGFLRDLPRALRAEGGRTAVVARRAWSGGCGRLISVAPASRAPRVLGAAFDLGTTTAVGELWDLASGRRLGVASRTNPQREYGADVISRAEHAAGSPGGLRDLQRLAAGCLDEILAECLRSAGCRSADVHDLVVAGNTVMQHLLLGVTPEHIAMSPFAPAFAAARSVPAAEVLITAAPGARLSVLPAVSGYVGGDIVAGLLATGLLDGADDASGPVLFIDIGTNGEMVLVAGGQATACSTAAGPAFEGARISHGCRAMSGAVEEVRFDGTDLVCLTIDGAAPLGICGTGLIDAAAELVRTGLADETGRLLEPGELPAGTPAALAGRVRLGQDGPEVLLGAGREIPLTGRDLRELQLAKAAVRAGAETLLAEAGLAAGDLARVLLAGAFGSYIDPANALAIGLLPAVPVERVAFGGNTSAAGARLALLDRAQRERAAELARSVRYLELSGRPDFQERFAEAMFFPGAASG